MIRGALAELAEWREPCHDCGEALRGQGRFTLDVIDGFKIGFMVCLACHHNRAWKEMVRPRGWLARLLP